MGVSQKKRKIYLYMWDYENYITDDKKKYTYTYTHTLKKGQSLIGEGTDGMANKSEEFFFFRDGEFWAKVQNCRLSFPPLFVLSSIEYHLVVS